MGGGLILRILVTFGGLYIDIKGSFLVISVFRMEDIIERYRNEVILDGLRLGSPLPIVRIDQC